MLPLSVASQQRQKASYDAWSVGVAFFGTKPLRDTDTVLLEQAVAFVVVCCAGMKGAIHFENTPTSPRGIPGSQLLYSAYALESPRRARQLGKNNTRAASRAIATRTSVCDRKRRFRHMTISRLGMSTT